MFFILSLFWGIKNLMGVSFRALQNFFVFEEAKSKQSNIVSSKF
jgi:hypothetical protein